MVDRRNSAGMKLSPIRGGWNPVASSVQHAEHSFLNPFYSNPDFYVFQDFTIRPHCDCGNRWSIPSPLPLTGTVTWEGRGFVFRPIEEWFHVWEVCFSFHHHMNFTLTSLSDRSLKFMILCPLCKRWRFAFSIILVSQESTTATFSSQVWVILFKSQFSYIIVKSKVITILYVKVTLG